MKSPTPLPSPPKYLNPLWIIFLFFAFSESVLGFGIFRTNGTVQFILVVFVVAFPVFVACAFFKILWHRPQILFSPRDFRNDSSYIEVLNNLKEVNANLPIVAADIERKITERLSEDGVAARLASVDKSKLQDALKSEVSRASEEVKKSTFMTLVFSPGFPKVKTVSLPIEAFGSFGQLLDTIFYDIGDSVRPYAYGYDWVLRDRNGKKIFQGARVLKGIPLGVPADDKRTLAEVGITAGMELEVVKLENPQ